MKGITRQVVVVKEPDPKLFDQAIFLLREDAIADGGISEETLLKEARMVCRESSPSFFRWQYLLWALAGSMLTGLIWLLTVLI